MKKILIFSASLLLFVSFSSVALASENPGDVEQVSIELVDEGVKVTWSATTDDVAVTGYQVHYGTTTVDDPGETYDTFIDVGDVLEYVFTDLDEGETYFFSVVAYDEDALESINWSPEVSIEVPTSDEQGDDDDDDDEQTLALENPDNVQNLEVEVDKGVVELTWDEVDYEGDIGYEIYYGTRSVEDGDAEMYDSIIRLGDVTEYEIKNLPGGIRYHFSVGAYSYHSPHLASEDYSNEETVFVGNVGHYIDTDFDVYERSIDYLTDNGIVQGYTKYVLDIDGQKTLKEFRPNNPINRAELLKIVVEGRFKGYDASTLDKHHFEQCFWDVPAEQWYTKYICYSKAVGWIQGYEDGSFKPDQNITMVEALKILLEAYGMSYPPTTPWYNGVVVEASDGELIPLTADAFDRPITRGEMADMVARKMTRVKGGFYGLFGHKIHSLYLVTYENMEDHDFIADDLYWDWFYDLDEKDDGTLEFKNELSGVEYEITLADYPEIFGDDWILTSDGAFYVDGYIYFSLFEDQSDRYLSKIVKLYVEDDLDSDDQEFVILEYPHPEDGVAILQSYDLVNEGLIFTIESYLSPEEAALVDPDECYTFWPFDPVYFIYDSKTDFGGYYQYYIPWWKADFELINYMTCAGPGSMQLEI